MLAYDYTRQQWIKDEEARLVLIAQVEATLDLLNSDGERYLKFVGIKSTVNEAIAAYQGELAALKRIGS